MNDKINALEQAIEHHESNLEKLENAEGVFATHRNMFKVGNTVISFDSKDCALCQLYITCEDCPLEQMEYGCEYPDSPWTKLNQATTQKEAIKAEKGMIKTLKTVLKEVRKEKD